MIETERLLLRPMRSEDVDALLRVFTDPKVMAAFAAPAFDRQQMEQWVQRNLAHQARYGYGLFSVIHKRDGVLIGDCGLEHRVVEEQPAIELGYDLHSAYWQQGLATEAARAVCEYGWEVLKLPALISLIRQGNHASRRVAEKLGMQRQSDLRRGEVAYWVYQIEHPQRR